MPFHGAILPERRVGPATTIRPPAFRPPSAASASRPNRRMATPTTDTEAIAATLRSALETETDVVAAYLYGSIARENQRRDSDVDVALKKDAPAHLTEFRDTVHQWLTVA